MSTPLLHLEDRLTHLSISPALGGSLVNWTAKEGGHALLRHSDQAAPEAGTPRRLACYPLAPWSNRIAEGGFDGPDGWLPLAPNTDHDPYPIHGSAWQQPWQVAEHRASRLSLYLESSVPFAYRAEQHITLDEGQLSIELLVTHQDARAAWHGLGLHPYVTRTAHTLLQAPARAVWLGDAGQLANREQDIPAKWDFRTAAALPEDLLDNAFSGWSGQCRIVQPDLGYELACQATGADYYLVYCPEGKDFFCFEPVSHPINAHHLPGHPGLQLLRQGQSTRLLYRMQYHSLHGETGVPAK